MKFSLCTTRVLFGIFYLKKNLRSTKFKLFLIEFQLHKISMGQGLGEQWQVHLLPLRGEGVFRYIPVFLFLFTPMGLPLSLNLTSEFQGKGEPAPSENKRPRDSPCFVPTPPSRTQWWMLFINVLLSCGCKMKMPPQRIYVFCLNVSPKSVQRASVVFAFQCLLVWVVEIHAPTGARAGWNRKVARMAAAELLWDASKIHQEQVQAHEQRSSRNFSI